MANVKFELNRAGVRELLTSSAMQNVLEQYGSAAVRRLGDGYEAVNGATAKSVRAKCKVQATTFEARRDNLKNNTILKAVMGG